MTDSDSTDRRSFVRAALAEHEKPLLRYAARLTGDAESARDVVQETFLSLCRQERAKLNGSLPQWLYTVCRNRALDLRRKDGRMISLRQSATATAPPVEACSSEDPTPAEQAETHDTSDEVMREVAKLSDNQQEVLRLRFHAGLSYREISGVTGLTVTNVGYLIHKAISVLRTRLE